MSKTAADSVTSSNESKSNGKERNSGADFHLDKKLSHRTKFYLRLRPESSKDKYHVTVLARNGHGGASSNEMDDLLSRKLFKSLNLVDSEEVDAMLEYEKNLFLSSHDNIRFPDSNDDNDDTETDGGIIEVDKSIERNETKSRQQQPTNTNLLSSMGTVIEMGIQSQLLIGPGTTGQLYFEITNYRTEAVFHNFQVTGEQRFLISINLQSFLLASGQTVIVIVTVRIPPNTQIGIKDQITFTCQGYGQSSKTATLRVVQPSENEDRSQPNLHWTFGSRCDGNKQESGVCSDAFWSIDVTAHDWGTGLLRIQSNPKGLYSRSSYTSGTTSPVTAVYSANCCQPRVTVSATDLAGNTRTTTIDVRDIYLTEAAIAAIVVGALLLIVLIILIVVLIVWCCKRRRESLDMPTYRSHSRISTT